VAVPIPPLGADGLLPEGVHDASMAEVRERFGRFRGTDRRVRLFAALASYVADARASGLVEAIIVDGSFTTGDAAPGDVDLIVVARPRADLTPDLRPDQYNVLSPRWIGRRYPLDVRLVSGSAGLEDAMEFFGRVRDDMTRKGMVRIGL
jgi:hypothetical protein